MYTSFWVVTQLELHRIVELFNLVEKPYKYLTDTLSPVAPKLVHLLGSLKLGLSNALFSTTDILRKSDLFDANGVESNAATTLIGNTNVSF
jgi:hypothetical protein